MIRARSMELTTKRPARRSPNGTPPAVGKYLDRRPEQLAHIRSLETKLGEATKAKLTAESAASAAELAVTNAKTKAEYDNKVAAAEVQTQAAALEKAKVDVVNAEAAIEAAKVTAAHKKSVAAAELAKGQIPAAALSGRRGRWSSTGG